MSPRDAHVRTFGDVHHIQLEDGALKDTVRDEDVAHEEPLELQIQGASVAVVMRTPGHDEDLGLGFLVTEQIVRSVHDVESIRHCTRVPSPEAEDNVLQIRLRPHVPLELERLRRHTFASSSCGVCGKATIENACALVAPLTDDARLSARALLKVPDALAQAQAAFALTGGLHAAGMFQLLDGALVVVREDVGRHNAVDKVIGHALSRGWTLDQLGLMVSGRVGFELVQKAAAARVPVIAGISAPTSLAVRMGRAMRVTVVGFLRGRSLNAYSAPERITP